MDKKIVGVIFILGASLFWAIEILFAKLAYINSDVMQTSAIRSIIVLLFAFVFLLINNKGNFAVEKKHIPKIIYIGIAATIVADLLYYYALTKIPIINAVLIGHMQPLFIVLFGYFILKEDKITKYDYLGIGVMIIAGIFVTTRTLDNLFVFNIGTKWDLLLLLATMFWATTALVARKYLREVNVGIIIFYRFLVSSLLFIIYLFFTDGFAISNQYQIYLGIAVTLGLFFYYEGIKKIKAAQAGALEITTPFFAVILGFFVFGEKITILQGFGLLLLILGVYFLSRKEGN